jgi:uncharacterized repeat protein (TIGR01451 family)
MVRRCGLILTRWGILGVVLLLIPCVAFVALATDGVQAVPPDPPYLVKDINTGTSWASPDNLADVDGTLFFSGHDGTYGAELWMSDGTVTGTLLVKDIQTGASGSYPEFLAALGSTVYFSADDGVHGRELWKSDGTEAGTVLVRDVYAGTTGAEPEFLNEANGLLLFFADDGTNGKELWKSDGTTAGTTLVKDICPGGGSSAPSSERAVTVMSGTLYFRANDCSHGQELWRSDGTTAGTMLVKDIYIGLDSASPDYLTAMDGTLFFAASYAASGTELWKSDGTEGGTVLVKDIYVGGNSSSPRYMVAIGGTLFFSATESSYGRELWKSDGTELGTVLVKDINPGGFQSSNPIGFTEAGGQVVFYAQHYMYGGELWKTDGSEAGTSMVKDIYPGSEDSYTGLGVVITGMDGIAYFPAEDGTHGHELWRSDGTITGTVLVKDIYPEKDGSYAQSLMPVGGTLYFAAEDNVHSTELWKSDGTEAGTILVKDINTWGGSADLEALTAIGDRLVFKAFEGTHGRELWMSDGTEAGTTMIKDINPGAPSSYPHGFTDLAGAFFFKATHDVYGYELWKSDGTEAGTTLVKDINPGSEQSDPWEFTVIGNIFLFRADDGSHGYELWKSDGTEAGTILVRDIVPGSTSSHPNSLVAVAGTLFFRADVSGYGYELWKSDGTEAGTVLVKDIYPGSSSSYPGDLTNVDGTLFFSANDGSYGTELWKSDGTEAGTVRVRDIAPGSASSYPWMHTVIDGTAFFAAEDGSNGRELWKSDGTDAGTVLVKDINPGGGGSDPRFAAQVDGTLFFSADDGTHGEELWKSDGTEAGTMLVKDINPGSEGAGLYYENAAAANGLIFFTANDGVHGYELWVSDGTEAGTILLADVGPPQLEGGASRLAIVNGTLFFHGNDYTHGEELWALIVGPLDLAITKAVEPVAWIGPGMPLTYTLTFSNVGPGPATGIVLTDIVPADVIDLSYTSSGATITPTGGLDYVWQVAPLAPGEGGVITVTGTIDPSVSGVFSLTNRAVITSPLGDVYPADNESAVTITVDAEPPLPPVLLSPADGAVLTDSTPTLAWQPSPSPDAAGYLLDWNSAVSDVGDVTLYTTPVLADGTYTWTVAAYDDLGNTGAYTDAWSLSVCTAVADVQIKRKPEGDLFSGNLVLFAAIADGTLPFHYAWTLDGEPVGGDKSMFEHTFEPAGTYTVAVSIANACGQAAGSLVVEVQAPEPDQPDLSLSDKSASLANVGSSDLVTYTLFLRNREEVAASATLTDPIPAHTTYVPGSAEASDGNPVTFAGGQLHWSGQIISGTPVVVEFAVEVGTPPAGQDIVNEAHLGDGLGNVLILEASSTYNPGYGLLINDGALATNIPTVTLRYQWNVDDGITHVQFSNDVGFGPEGDTTAWLPVNAADPTYPDWVLDTSGDNRHPCWVYARFREAGGRLRPPVRDVILYDPEPPSEPIVEIVPLVVEASRGTEAGDVLVRVTATDANSGVSRLHVSDDPAFLQFTAYKFVGPTTEVPWTLPTSGMVYVRVVDRAGNLSVVTSAQGQVSRRIYLPLIQRAEP